MFSPHLPLNNLNPVDPLVSLSGGRDHQRALSRAAADRYAVTSAVAERRSGRIGHGTVAPSGVLRWSRALAARAAL
ncbi:MAG: hypothetical protein ABWX96_22930 [Propionibacteriaceae bacterium]